MGVGHQKILHTRQCTGTGDRIARNDQRQHHQHRHHHLGDALHAVAHTSKDNAQREQAEQQKGQFGLQAVGDKAGEVAVCRQIAAAAAQVLGQIVDDPAADDRIIRHDQNGDDGVDPTAKPDALALTEVGVGADRAFVGHTAQRGLGHDHGIAKGDCQQNVYQQKNAAAVFGCQIREAPDVAQTHRSACGRQHEPDLTGECAALVLLFHVVVPLFLSAIKIKQNKCTTSAYNWQAITPRSAPDGADRGVYQFLFIFTAYGTCDPLPRRRGRRSGTCPDGSGCCCPRWKAARWSAHRSP